MARRKSGTKVIQPPVKQNTPWYKNAWPILTATVGVISSIIVGIIFLLQNGSTLIENAEKLPSDIERVTNSFLAWNFKDKEWEGTWSANPEGYIDMGDMNLSDVDMVLIIGAKNGEIGGAIVTKKICSAQPLLHFILLTGSINGNTANVIAYDYIRGKREEFAHLKLERDGVVMTVTPIKGAKEWFPDKSIIAQHPDTEIEGNDEWDKLIDYCKEERDQVFKQLESTTFEGPADENGRRKLKKSDEM